MQRIASFSVDHDYIVPGLDISRQDGDVTTYDLRTRIPNSGDLMDNSTMHTCEHMLATYLRNGDIGDQIIYFGPMGCQTGFYLLVRNAVDEEVLEALKDALDKTVHHSGAVFGASRKECGNYQSLNLDSAKTECKRFLNVISEWTCDKMLYPTEKGFVI